MIQLKAGDVRQEGDEQRRASGYDEDYFEHYRLEYRSAFKWRPIDLIGHRILSSDLFVSEFRRP